jgi:dipeptidyl aminopeptidase/acylaminoacyl peptidase
VVFKDDDGVHLVDRSGKLTTLSRRRGAYTLNWSASGQEIWFSAGDTPSERALYRVSLSSRERLLYRIPGNMILEDVSAEGRLLIRHGLQRVGMAALAPGETKERDLSLFDRCAPLSISDDGRTLLVNVAGRPSGVNDGTYLRRTDGSAGVRLGEGRALSLSHDGKWALSRVSQPSPHVLVLPTGPGESQTLRLDGVEPGTTADWFPDGTRIAVDGHEPGRAWRVFAQDLRGGKPQPLTPENFRLAGWRTISPDGRLIAAAQPGGRLTLFPVDGGDPRELGELETDSVAAAWSPDGRWLYTNGRPSVPGRVFRVDPATGHGELWKEIMPPDPVAVTFLEVLVTPDGKSYAYNYGRHLMELYLVEGLQ